MKLYLMENNKMASSWYCYVLVLLWFFRGRLTQVSINKVVFGQVHFCRREPINVVSKRLCFPNQETTKRPPPPTIKYSHAHYLDMEKS